MTAPRGGGSAAAAPARLAAEQLQWRQQQRCNDLLDITAEYVERPDAGEVPPEGRG